MAARLDGSAASATRPSARTRTVLVYLALALIALLPGLMLKFGIGTGIPAADALLDELRQRLDDIRFGSGPRFWLGVTGATMLGLLLLYPLRKLAKGRWLGSVRAWFHIHLIIGLAGPVLILYHCDFGHGGSNANVALWSMLTVVFSGIAGHFVYQSVSAEFYQGKQKAREQLDAIAAVFAALNAMHLAKQKLLDELETFEVELLTPRQGVFASLNARWRVESRRRHFANSTSWLLAQSAQQLGLDASKHQQLRAVTGAHLSAYVRIARHTSTRSVREQIWARWRLFHLPVFLIMVAAVVLHVVAVWNMDAPVKAAVPSATATATARATETAAAAGAKPQASARTAPEVRRVATVPIAPGPAVPQVQSAELGSTSSAAPTSATGGTLALTREPTPASRQSAAPTVAGAASHGLEAQGRS